MNEAPFLLYIEYPLETSAIPIAIPAARAIVHSKLETLLRPTDPDLDI